MVGTNNTQQHQHPLVYMKDAETALDILSSGDRVKAERVALCVCCVNRNTASCPHKGTEKVGLCGDYRLNETNIEQTETRVLAFLQG